jgi:molybdenum cofactor biosynthesis enzyme MoaA
VIADQFSARGRRFDHASLLETVRGWLPEWKALGVRHVALTGGEARMHSGVWELMQRQLHPAKGPRNTTGSRPIT